MSYGGDYRVSVYDRFGVYLAELDCAFHCIWALNEAGSANFTLSRFDPKCTERICRFGNYVVFEHARLGDWGGLILPHDGRDWSGDGFIKMRARSAEFNFSRRRAPLYDAQDGLFWAGTAGDLFERIINHMNFKSDTRVRPGDIRKGGITMIVGLRLAMWDRGIAQLIKRTNRRMGGKIWLEPMRGENGRLIFKANFLLTRGENAGYVLKEDINIETPSGQFFREDGVLINDIAVMSSESDGANFQVEYYEDQDSIGEYGLFEGSDSITSDNEDAIQKYARDQVKQGSEPNRVFELLAIETTESPDTFAHIRPGDIANVDLYSVGFWFGRFGVNSRISIDSIEYDTEEDKAILVVEEAG